MGHVMVHTQEGSDLYMHTEFESDSSIRSKVIRGGCQNFKIWSQDPSHSHLGVILWSVPLRGSNLYVHTKFEADRASVSSKVIRGSQNFESGSHDPDHAQFGVIF